MHENYYAACRVWAWLCWSLVVSLLVSAWAVMLASQHEWRIAFLLGGSACVISPVAATLHVRSFAVRLSSLVRAASYAPDLEHRGLHPVG